MAGADQEHPEGLPQRVADLFAIRAICDPPKRAAVLGRDRVLEEEQGEGRARGLLHRTG